MANEKGVWRTIGGRRVFIKEGQDLASAMKESGKFKSASKGTAKKEMAKEEKVFEDFKNSDGSKENFEKALNKISEMEYNNEINPDEYKDYISKIQKEYVEKNRKAGEENDLDKVKRIQGDLNKKGDKLTKEEKAWKEQLANTQKELESGKSREDIIKDLDREASKTSNFMNDKIRSRGKSKVEEDDLPKHTEIKTQGTSNRKEVSENIQAHILDYYTEDYTGENISPSEAFVRQMDAMGESNMWRAGQKNAEGGSYLIYNGDMADFLDELKINPKGKTFSEDKAFDMYTSLIGRESAKLYDRIQKNSYKKYMKAHPLSKMSFEEFKDMNKK